MSVKKDICGNCKHFDNSKHIQDIRTEKQGVCSKVSMVLFKHDLQCKFFAKRLNSFLDIEVVDPIYVLPKTQMTMFEIIDFIN